MPSRASPAPSAHSSATRAAAGERNGTQIAPLARKSCSAPSKPELTQDRRREMAGAERHEHDAVLALGGVAQDRAIVAEARGDRRHALVQPNDGDRLGSPGRRVQPHASLHDPPERTGGRRAECDRAGAVDFAHRGGGVHLAAEGHDHAQSGGGGCPSQNNGVEQICGSVRARRAPRPVGAGDDDWGLATVGQRADHRDLLHRVGAGRHDHALAERGGFAGAARQVKRIGQGELGARQREHGLGLEVKPRHLGKLLDELGSVQRRHGALAAHRDRAAGREQAHRASASWGG